MNYPYLLFDADDTLFDFSKSSARAFSILCQVHEIPNTAKTQSLYHAINQELWAALDRREISKDDVIHSRFPRFLRDRKSVV